MDDDDQFESKDRGRFRLLNRFKWQILLVLVVGGFIVVTHLPPPWAGGHFPYIPQYPGSSVVESHVYDPPILTMGTHLLAARMVMDISTDADYYKSIGSPPQSYSDAYYEFDRTLGENNWQRGGLHGCHEYVWSNAGYPAAQKMLSPQDDSNIWTLVVESEPVKNKEVVTRLTFTVTKGFDDCGGGL